MMSYYYHRNIMKNNQFGSWIVIYQLPTQAFQNTGFFFFLIQQILTKFIFSFVLLFAVLNMCLGRDPFVSNCQMNIRMIISQVHLLKWSTADTQPDEKQSINTSHGKYSGTYEHLGIKVVPSLQHLIAFSQIL